MHNMPLQQALYSIRTVKSGRQAIISVLDDDDDGRSLMSGRRVYPVDSYYRPSLRELIYDVTQILA